MAESTLGTAQIAIRAVTDKLDSDLSGARKMVTGVLEDIKKPVMIGFGAVTGAIAAVGVGLTAYIGHATMAASRTSEMRAVLNLLGERAGWSADQIENNVKSMRDLGIRTDVAQDILSQFARNQLDAADATMAARVAQDLAVLSGRDSSEVLSELNYAVQTQNSSLQVFRDLGIQAGDALKTYADSVGKTTDELSKAERMQAMLNAVQERGLDIAGVYETAMEEPGKAMRSLGRHFYEASLSVGQHFLPVLGKGVDFVTDFIKEIRGLLEEGAPLGDLFEALGGLAGFAAEKLFGLASDGMGGLAEKIGPAIEKVTEIVTLITDLWFLVDKGWLDPLDALKFGLTEVFGAEVADKVMDIITKIQEFITTVEEILEPITSWIKENVELNDVLAATAIVVGAVLIPIVWGLMLPFIKVIAIIAILAVVIAGLRKIWEEDFGGIRTALTAFWENTVKPTFEILREWLATNIPIAIEKLKNFWENVLLPAIQDVWAWIQDTLFPLFEILREWLATNIPIAIEKLKDFWDNVLLPAIQDVWAFIQNDLVPLFEALWELLQVAGGIAITALQGLWENVLQPALKAIWEFIKDNILPIFEELWAFIQKHLEPRLAGLAGVFDDISGAVQKVIGWIKDFTEKLRNIKLPDWLKPGSPAPIELTFHGMAAGLRDINAQFGRFALGLDVISPATSQDFSRSMDVTIYTQQSTGSIYRDLALVEAML